MGVFQSGDLIKVNNELKSDFYNKIVRLDAREAMEHVESNAYNHKLFFETNDIKVLEPNQHFLVLHFFEKKVSEPVRYGSKQSSQCVKTLVVAYLLHDEGIWTTQPFNSVDSFKKVFELVCR